eukprot:TRINITY_DN2159_c0_g3_i1.p1 TRINITY_DN2159_c0_g3~~TRINITY_DN2159_c0_g3_i1.p1  ORF type:complete len:305 (-),score=55.60 TRINITY_DN2159_c0_g3_i1:392-1306(-)
MTMTRITRNFISGSVLRRGGIRPTLFLLAITLCLVMCVNAIEVSAVTPPNCSTFDPSKIKLVTFDVFAALMDLYTSLERSVPIAAPSLTSSQVGLMIDGMVSGYGAYEGSTFTTEETGGLEPFAYVANITVTALVEKMQLTLSSTEFDALLNTWSDLIPWQGTQYTLNTLAASTDLELAPLSNGDADTLKQAMTIFAPQVNMSYIFSSNFPVGAFKPQPVMYEQLLNATGYSVDEILHVAGAPNDAQGAREAGFYSGLTWNAPSPGVQPCFLFSNITDVLKLFIPSSGGVDDDDDGERSRVRLN